MTLTAPLPAVGSHYAGQPQTHPEGLAYQFCFQGHRMTLFTGPLCSDELQHLQSGPIEVSPVLREGVTILAARLLPDMRWLLMTFGVSCAGCVCPVELLITRTHEPMPLSLHVVEAATGVVLVARSLEMPPELWTMLSGGMRAMADAPLDAAELERRLARIHSWYGEGGDLPALPDAQVYLLR